MNKFGLTDDEDEETLGQSLAKNWRLSHRLRRDRRSTWLQWMLPRLPTDSLVGKPRKRGGDGDAVPLEPTRHLAIRLVSSEYDRFVAYADRHQLTYHDAISRSLDSSVGVTYDIFLACVALALCLQRQ